MPDFRQTRREFLKLAGSSLAVMALPHLSCTSSPVRSNFIIIIGDDVGWNDIGVYGNPAIRTPNIDQLARQGIQYTNAFLTISSCSPSRSSIMTGRYPHATGAGELHQPLPADQLVFAGLLKQAGYYTASAGKWHLGDAARVNFATIVDSGPSGCEKWVEVLQNRPPSQPFFMWFAAYDPHRPYAEDTLNPPHQPDEVVVPPFLPDVPETRQDLAAYYDEIGRLDSYVGQVLAELERQGLTDNTFVLFLSDNGRPFPRCKTTLYDSGVKTPFIIRWPVKIKAGQINDHLVSSIDIAPTIMELAGLEAAPSFQGKSFAPMLFDSGITLRDYVFAEHNWHDFQAHERSVRSKTFLYIKNAFPHLTGSPPADAVHGITFQKMQKMYAAGQLTPQHLGCFIVPRPGEELYDVRNDPYSFKNLAFDPQYASVLAEMRETLLAWERATNDRVPLAPTPDKFDRFTGDKLATTSN